MEPPPFVGETLNECGICLENLNCPSYIPPNQSAAFNSVKEESPQQTSRFPCGHAFHSNCAVQSLFSSRRCPSCRSNIDPSSSLDNETNMNILNDAANDAILTMTFNTDPTLIHDATMIRIRAHDRDVKRERLLFRHALAEYNRLQDRMRHRRRSAIQEALGALRRRHYTACDEAIVSLQKKIQSVQGFEAAAWERATGHPPSGSSWEDYLSLSAIDFIGPSRLRTESMLDRRFWSLR
jgi:hypothetical protein